MSARRGLIKVDDAGGWSGGGQVLVRNLQQLAAAYELPEAGDVNIVPRNFPAQSTRPGRRDAILIPQNAWPFSLGRPSLREVGRVVAMRALSEMSMRLARGVVRISSAIPPIGRVAPSVLHNVLDEEFELKRERAELTDRAALASGSIVSVGGVSSYRNFANLIRAHQRYLSSGGSLPLFLAGPPLDPATVRHLGYVASRAHKVTYLPESLTREETLAVFAEARCVVLPSLVEASPVTLLEALAMNSNVGASDIVANRELLNDERNSVQFFSPHSPTEMSTALLRLESEHFESTRIARQSHRSVTRKVWMDRMFTTICEVAGDRTTAS